MTNIKEAFEEAQELTLIDLKMEFGVDTDASRIGIGARLYQMEERTGEQHTVAYESRSLRPAETQYTMTELEGLTLVYALRKWAVQLLGRKVKVNTDQRALTYMSVCASSSQRIARWVSFL